MTHSSGTQIDEINDGIFRINTPIPDIPGGFSFNQYLVLDDEPLLFHTGQRGLFPAVRQAIAKVVDPARLRWLGFSHVEADECGALNHFLADAPHATPLCSTIAAMVSMQDLADRAPRGMNDGEELTTGKRKYRWVAAPHVPHGWENGFLFETTTRTLFCGDLFTQGGATTKPRTETDIVGPSDAFRKAMDYWSYGPNTASALHRLAAMEPTTLACMHGSAFAGDGAKALLELKASLPI